MQIITQKHTTSHPLESVKNMTDYTKFWHGVEQQELSYTAAANVQWYSHFGKGSDS